MEEAPVDESTPAGGAPGRGTVPVEELDRRGARDRRGGRRRGRGRGRAADEEVIPEIDLSELEDLPVVGLEPTVHSSTEEIAEEVSADDGESEPSSSKTQRSRRRWRSSEADAVLPSSSKRRLPPTAETVATPEEDFSFELDIDEVSAQLAEAGDDVAEELTPSQGGGGFPRSSPSRRLQSRPRRRPRSSPQSRLPLEAPLEAPVEPTVESTEASERRVRWRYRGSSRRRCRDPTRRMAVAAVLAASGSSS